MKSAVKKIVAALLVLCFAMCVYVLGVNFYVVGSQKDRIVSRQQAQQLDDVDYILVLGCGIKGNRPSHMLEDRLLEALAIADGGQDCKVILSGDNSGDSYNEVGVMKNYMLEKGFDEERIITDDTGFSTGESIENAGEKYDAEKIIIVTQHFHDYRALFIAQRMGIDAVAVASDPRQYSTWLWSNIREVAARNKDFIKYTFFFG